MSKKQSLRTNKELEECRFKAWELHETGRHPDEIAEVLGVTEQTIRRWLQRAKTEGIETLRTCKRSGVKPRLNAPQRQRLLKLLIYGARQYGFVNDVWTSKQVCLVIQREFGVIYSPRYIKSLLDKLGWRLSTPEPDSLRRKIRSTLLAS
jgi:putative transposase